MNAFSVLSVVFTVISLLLIGLLLIGLVVDEGFIIAAMGNVLVAVYLDHLGIEKDLRDFLAEGRAKR